MIELTDSHCHIHFDEYDYDVQQTLLDARVAGVTRIVAVGTDVDNSVETIEFARQNNGIIALVGVHPHEATKTLAENQFKNLERLVKENIDIISGIGECGLDYHYEHSTRKDQKRLLEMHLDLAAKYNLPISFHVREAFDDFWAILDNSKDVRGVVHSFSSGSKDMKAIMGYGLYVGINGIITFSREEDLLESVKQAPLERMLLETDAPYLTPKPYRVKINNQNMCGWWPNF